MLLWICLNTGSLPNRPAVGRLPWQGAPRERKREVHSEWSNSRRASRNSMPLTSRLRSPTYRLIGYATGGR
eukprot:9091331-Pyramimonas_sp.AAC.1